MALKTHLGSREITSSLKISIKSKLYMSKKNTDLIWLINM